MKVVSRTKVRADAQTILDSIRRLVQTIRHSSKECEKRLGVSSAQLFILQKIADSHQALSVNDLAKRTRTHQSSVSVVVSKLVRRKLIQRSRSKMDSRAVELKLSHRGLTLLQNSPDLIQERLTKAVAKMQDRDRKNLIRGLNVFIQKAGLDKEKPSLFFEDERIVKA